MADAQNPNEPVILNTEPQQIRININDPSKPKPKFINKIPAKPSAKDRLKQAFLGENVDNVGDYILTTYLEPAGKRMLNNASQTILQKIGYGIQILLFGKVITNQNGGVDYTSYYNPNIAPGQQQQQQQQKAFKVMDAVDTYTLSKNDADETLAYLRGRIGAYGSASVLDYYEHIGAPFDYMQSDRGWRNLDAARVLPMPGNGFYIDFPRPIYLKRG